MKIAVLSDIHGNLPALRKVFATMPRADACVCAGDIVGYYSYVNEVCAYLRTKNVLCIRGNHDAYVSGELTPDLERRDAYRTDWTKKELSKENFRWLASLSPERRLSGRGFSMRIRHASPWDEETYIYPDSKSLDRIALEPGEILVLGHSHRPMDVACGKGRVVNPGSVGQPRDWDPRASYMMVDTEMESFSIRRVPYAVGRLQSHLASRGWPPATIAILTRTRAAR